MRKIILVTITFLTLLLFFYYRAHPLATRVEINGTRFTVELAITDKEKVRGLGYRDSLSDGSGMLFVYQNKDRYNFWMKGMRFPIDILWIQDAVIVDITANVPVSTSSVLPTYAPKIPVNQILELNAGTAEKFGIKTGDSVKILKN